MYPSKEFLGRYRIIITTLVTAGRSESPHPRGLHRVWAARGFPAGVQQGGTQESGAAPGRVMVRAGRLARQAEPLTQPHAAFPQAGIGQLSPTLFLPRLHRRVRPRGRAGERGRYRW